MLSKRIHRWALIAVLMAIPIAATAGDDPTIQGELRTSIQSEMKSSIDSNTGIDGHYVVYDAVEGKLLKLKMTKLHSGIVKKGDYYVSCADFVDKNQTKYDLDFLVNKTKSGMRVLETVVHSVSGKKRKYHLED